MIARWLAPAALVAGLAAFAVCSNGSGPPAVSGLGTAGTGGGAGPAGTGGGVAYVATCPVALPADGAACIEADRTCSYGTAPRGECRDRATCVGGHWAVHAGACAPPSLAADCPAAAPAPQALCTKDQQLCAYPDGRECVCFAGAISKLGWVCDAPRNTGGDCPASAPNAGTPCAGTASCTYVCGLLTANSVLARCVSGAWTWAFTPCSRTN
jgi:hypothetical protein